MKKIRLGDVLEVKRGASLSGKYYSCDGNLIRLTLGNFNYPNGGFKKNTSKEDIYFVGKIDNSYILKKGDVITPLTEQVNGLLGETARIPVDNLYIQSGDIGLLIPDENLIDSSFMYYLISSSLIKKQLSASAQQTKIRHTSPDKIKKCVAWIPSLNEQKKIGKLLDNLTSVIENNINLISDLEKQIEKIYDYWFNQYEFPNDQGKPYKSSGGEFKFNKTYKKNIPESWNLVYLKDVVSKEKNAIVDGPFGTQLKIGEYDKNGNIPIYEMDLLEGNFIVKRNKNFINEKKYEEVKRSTVKDGDIIISKTGTLGLLGIVRSDYSKGLLVSRLAKITPDESVVGKYGLYLYLSKLTQNNYWLKKSGGSTMPILNNSTIENVPFLLPDNELYIKFEKKIAPLFEQIYLCQKEIEKFKELKNTITPLLLNGQIKL